MAIPKAWPIRIKYLRQLVSNSGGPPVSVWRELRRIHDLPEDAPQHLRDAHRAANKQIQNEGDEAASVSWAGYCRAQGGATIGRAAAIKLAKRETDTMGRYGDAQAPRPVGVETWGFGTGDADCTRVVESERRKWTIERAPPSSTPTAVST